MCETVKHTHFSLFQLVIIDKKKTKLICEHTYDDKKCLSKE